MQQRTLVGTQCAAPCAVAYGHAVQLPPVARPRRSARDKVVAKAVDIPGDLHVHASGSTGGKCPFLAGLRSPPMIDLPWLKRVQLQVLHPADFQRTLLSQSGSETMIQVAKQPLFNGFYMPATMQLTKDVFAAEGDGTTTQGLGGNNFAFKGFGTLLGEDSLLIVSDPDRHKQLRALLQPAFNADAIAAYLPDIQSLVHRHLASWEAAGAQGVKGYVCLKMLTFDFILQVAMGQVIPDDELRYLSGLFNSLVRGLVAWPFLNIPFTPWNRALKAQQELIAYFQTGVTKTRQQLAAGGDAPGVLGRLVAAVDEEGNRLTDKEICDNMLLLLVAGHDTSSTTLTRCMSNLQDNPAVWDKLKEEQAAVVARHGNDITAAVLREMTYADAVIRETLRLDPVVNGVVRITTRDFELGGYAVPAGTRLSLPLRDLAANDPRWIHSQGEMHPLLFNPDRLTTPSGVKPGQLMPFGGGVRYCLGAALAMAEMKVYLAMLARSYDFTVDNNTEWKPALGYYPANGLPLVLMQRGQ